MCEGMTDTFLHAAHSGAAAASLASSGRAPGGSRLRSPRHRGKPVAAARPARCRPGGGSARPAATPHPRPVSPAVSWPPGQARIRSCAAPARPEHGAGGGCGSRAAPGSASSPRPRLEWSRGAAALLPSPRAVLGLPRAPEAAQAGGSPHVPLVSRS